MHDRAAFLFTGKGKIRDATLNVPSLSKPMQIHHSDLTFSADSLALQGLSATTGETNVNGSLTIKGLAAPQVEFSLHADKVSVTDVQQFFALAGTEPGQAARGGAESAQANASSLLNRMNGGGTMWGAGCCAVSAAVAMRIRAGRSGSDTIPCSVMTPSICLRRFS